MAQMLEFSNKDFKAVIIKIFQEALINTFKTNGKIDSLSKEIKYINNNLKNFTMEKYNKFLKTH